jgi:K+-dependent Na+/Ca+ exchanger-like protein
MIEIVGSLAIIVGAVYLLAIITDSFFIISLDQISRRLNLSDEVAGASLMAMGSSAPELAIALIALFSGGGAHSDVGVGAIVGSAVFNILVITGVSAVAANGLRIHMFAVRHDTAYYLLSIGYLALIFSDGQVVLWEAGLGIVAYAIYVIMLAVWKAPEKPEEEREQKVVESPEYPQSDNLFRQVEAAIVKVIKMITGAPSENYVWTFIVAIAFIIVLSYILVEATLVFSAGIGIPPVIVALTLLAAGTSAPDLISSIEVAKEGRGGMAVANAIGSDIFDVFIGLGVPWVIAIIALGKSEIIIDVGDLWVSIGILVATTLVLYGFLHTERNLSRNEGIILLVLYAAFVIYTVVAGTGAPPPVH